MVGFEKVLGAVKVIKDQIQYRSQSLLNLARDYFSGLDSARDLIEINLKKDNCFYYLHADLIVSLDIDFKSNSVIVYWAL